MLPTSLNNAEQRAFNSCIADEIQYLTARLNFLNTQKKTVHWYSPMSFLRTYHWGLTGKTGVYKIIHNPTNKVVYIGQGNLMQRRTLHKKVFNNRGNTLVYENSSVDSPAARKMYLHDDNLANWSFQCFVCDKETAKRFEEELQYELEPAFNDLKMAGLS